MKRKKLLLWANTAALYSVLVRDAINENKFKTSLEVDQILKWLSRIEKLSNRIRESLLGGYRK